MPKRKLKKIKETEVPLWFMDGFTGVLALMIYNFVLYIIDIKNVGGILGSIENTMGYFGLNSFIDFGLSKAGLINGIILMFIFSYFLGIVISAWVRKKNKGKVV